MRIIVSDTSPIRVLDHLGLLDFLPRLFTEIVVPPKVLNELEYPASGTNHFSWRTSTGFKYALRPIENK
jgi:predicted nucleic acid-binding protein